MNHILTQLILAARRSNDGDTGLKQILVFVVLSLFYAIGSIVKAKSSKTATPKGKEPLKPPESDVGLRMLKQFFGYSEPEADEEPAASSQPRQQAVKPKLQPTHRKVARPTAATSPPPAKLKKSSEFTPAAYDSVSAAGKKPGDKTLLTQTPQAKYLSEVLSDYQDPERLRRAILHYEILGKPISLREPSEHLI
ncbi:MAG: hypothetical protein WC476_03620 [Phycisphaerae bacterium]|jgi:hypothetical protein